MSDIKRNMFAIIYDTVAKVTFPNCDVKTEIKDEKIVTTIKPKVR